MSMNIKIRDFLLPDLEVKINVEEELVDLEKNAVIEAVALYANKPIGWWDEFSKHEIEGWIAYVIETAFDLGRVAIIQQLIEQNDNKYEKG